MLLDKLKKDLNEAIKSRLDGRILILRLLLSEIKNYAINKYSAAGLDKITDEDIIAVLKKSVKTHRESIEMFKKGQRLDLVNKEEEELKIILSYLPSELDEETLRKRIKELLENFPEKSDFGKSMARVMEELRGKADGSVISKIVREEISQ